MTLDRTPTELLSLALVDLASAGRRTPCQSDPDAFTSDQYRTRAEAALACSWCPVLQPCAAAADDRAEVWLVWGGTDRTLSTRLSRAGKTTSTSSDERETA